MKLHELGSIKDNQAKKEWLDKVNSFLAGEFRGDRKFPLTAGDPDFEYYGLKTHPKHAALDIYNINRP